MVTVSDDRYISDDRNTYALSCTSCVESLEAFGTPWAGFVVHTGGRKANRR